MWREHIMSWCTSMTPRWRSPLRSDLPATCAWKYDECVEKHPQRDIYSTLWIVCMHLKCWATAFFLSQISAVHVKSSSEMCLKWQSEFIAAFIQCHDLLCSTWMYDEWHNRISQWSHFKSPLAKGKGSVLIWSVIWVLDYKQGGRKVKRW